MPKGWKKLTVHIQVKRRFRDIKPKKMSDSNFLNQLLDIYTAKPEKGSPPSVDTKTSNTSYDAPQCHYRAIDLETGKWYCDLKEVPRVACIQRQSRFISQGKRCYPKGKKFRRSTRKNPESSPEKPFINRGSIFRGHEEGGQW